ncbi:MAG: primase-helicase family protein [Planctomycetota bacterium]
MSAFPGGDRAPTALELGDPFVGARPAAEVFGDFDLDEEVQGEDDEDEAIAERREEVCDLWSRCVAATEDPQVAAWLRSRGLDPRAVAARDLVRAVPPRGELPRWGGCGGRSWRASGHRAVLPVFDRFGALAGLRARDVTGRHPKNKELSAAGQKGAGLVFACAQARALLEAGPGGEPGALLVVEGAPDWLTWALRDVPGAPAAIGLYSGAWKGRGGEELAARLPAGSLVIVRHHVDANGTGAGYAAEVARSLVGRCEVLVAQAGGGEVGCDDNDALRSGTLPEDPSEGAVAADAWLEQVAPPSRPSSRSRGRGANPDEELKAAQAFAATVAELEGAAVGEAVFGPRSVHLAAVLKTQDAFAFQKLRALVKASRSVKVGDWDKEVRKAERRARQGVSVEDPSQVARHVIAGGESVGWFVMTSSGWVRHGESGVSKSLRGLFDEAADATFYALVNDSWELVNRPFQSEYPPDEARVWNRNAVQLAHVPGPGEHPTWDRVLAHVGGDLDHWVKADPWCLEHGVTTGAGYLLLWVAALVQHPLDRLPYLFLHGPQDSGKSSLHEALSLLFVGGARGAVVQADKALTNNGDFNAELEGALVCVVEETNLRTNGQAGRAYARIKDWVTARELLIHPKGQTPYRSPNATHWIQCANSSAFCPIFSDDTRITMIRVDKPEQPIPKGELLAALEREAPAFLDTIVVKVTIPPAPGRLRLPVIATQDKVDQGQANRSLLEAFLATHNALALDAGEILEGMGKAFSGGEAVDRWDLARVQRKLTDFNDRARKAARALRAWFDGPQDREHWSGPAGELAQALGGEVGCWGARGLAARLGDEAVRDSLAAVGVRVVRPGPSDRPRNWTVLACQPGPLRRERVT